MTDKDNNDPDTTAAVVQFPQRQDAEDHTLTHEELTEMRRTALRRIDTERTDYQIDLWHKHSERSETVRSALRDLITELAPGIGNIRTQSSVNKHDLLALLEIVAIMREHLEVNEFEFLEVARLNGVGWEELDAIYAPVPATAAKDRFRKLAVRHHGTDFFGYDPSEARNP